MIVRALSAGRTSYYSGLYSLCVHPEGDMFAYHPCTMSEGDDLYYDHLTPEEMRRNQCRYCCYVDFPEDLLALYVLYKYGTGELWKR